MNQWINDVYESLKESNNKYIVFIGTRDTWDCITEYADSVFYDNCVLNDTRIDYFDPQIGEYYEGRYNNKKPDLILTEYQLTKIPKVIKKKLHHKFKVLPI